jgi:hypothetical protein
MTLNRPDGQYTGFVGVKVRVKYDIRVLQSKGFDVREVHAVVAIDSQLCGRQHAVREPVAPDSHIPESMHACPLCGQIE